eukprot:gnl/TRDRNA2_/TRDRNA2_140180_c6_seq2.p1 gnl/TRDRNA2_/TRDRNA2_140180_c6~~gnl/TRDRNA2_/TRDRNA2_140180_c6_seq2.p1  ORF type:complete len:479 (+),score=77.70 gnl/TRDRNA2_/TRDRNA2_140180_c6_seq2:211-1647(+)
MLVKAFHYLCVRDIFAMLCAAVCHDVAHPGFNNPFLVQTSHELALRYNDISPLENMHCSTMFEILNSSSDVNIFKTLTREQYKEVRRVCIETILHTDAAQHFSMIKELQMLAVNNSEDFDQPNEPDFPSRAEREVLRQEGNRILILNTLLHSADISNTCKPWNLCEIWANRVMDEFFLQGDMEKKLSIPVQALNDRDKVIMANSQVAFIQFFVAPFNTVQVQILPPLWQMSVCLESNLQRWHSRRTISDPAEAETAAKQVQGISDTLTAGIEKAQQRFKPQEAFGTAFGSTASIEASSRRTSSGANAPGPGCETSEPVSPNSSKSPSPRRRTGTESQQEHTGHGVTTGLQQLKRRITQRNPSMLNLPGGGYKDGGRNNSHGNLSVPVAPRRLPDVHETGSSHSGHEDDDDRRFRVRSGSLGSGSTDRSGTGSDQLQSAEGARGSHPAVHHPHAVEQSGSTGMEKDSDAVSPQSNRSRK